MSASRSHIPTPSIRDRLASGELVPDAVFDEIYPRWVRRRSRMHWTRVQIAVRAAMLLADRPGARLLDVGSGVGKFCIVAAAALAARPRGIEHRPHLVEIARSAAARIGVDVHFEHGTLAACDPADVDGIYIYNPFTENVCAAGDRIDDTVELSEERFLRDVAATEAILREARVGTRVVTYHGFGGEMPADYERVASELHGGLLELRVKTNRSSGSRLRAEPILRSSSDSDGSRAKPMREAPPASRNEHV